MIEIFEYNGVVNRFCDFMETEYDDYSRSRIELLGEVSSYPNRWINLASTNAEYDDDMKFCVDLNFGARQARWTVNDKVVKTESFENLKEMENFIRFTTFEEVTGDENFPGYSKYEEEEEDE